MKRTKAGDDTLCRLSFSSSSCRCNISQDPLELPCKGPDEQRRHAHGQQCQVRGRGGRRGRTEQRAGCGAQKHGEDASKSCANLTALVIVGLLPALVGATCGRLLLSGILDSQIDLVQHKLVELGIADFEIDKDGEWIALVI